jgi:quercetin dioxygenase-like cupin family protein
VYEVTEGNFIFIPPNVVHEYWAGEKGVEFLCLIPLKPTVAEDYNPCKGSG